MEFKGKKQIKDEKTQLNYSINLNPLSDFNMPGTAQKDCTWKQQSCYERQGGRLIFRDQSKHWH